LVFVPRCSRPGMTRQEYKIIFHATMANLYTMVQLD
jgi:hypothetical protein